MHPSVHALPAHISSGSPPPTIHFLQEPFQDAFEELQGKAEEAHCYLGAKAAGIASLEIPEQYHPQSCWARDKAGDGTSSGSRGSGNSSGSSSGSSNGRSKSSSSTGGGSAALESSTASAGAAADAAALGGPRTAAAAAAAPGGDKRLPGRVLRSDLHLYRSGTSMHLEHCCVPPSWGLLKGSEPARMILWGDSTQR